MTRKAYQARGVFLSWIVANLLGVAAIGLSVYIYPLVNFLPGRLASTLMIGLPIGIGQWIALRRVAPISILWVFTISAGLLLGLELGPFFAGIFLSHLDDESVLALSAGAATFGLCAGSIQWLLLQGHFYKSWVWLLSSAAGLGLGMVLILVSNLINISGILAIILVAVLYAATTGFVISWLEASHRKIGEQLVDTT
jgi:hypothetical protein